MAVPTKYAFWALASLVAATCHASQNVESVVTPKQLAEILTQFHADAGRLQIVKVRESTPFRLLAICSGERGQHWRLGLQVEPQHPNRLDVFSFAVSDYWSAPAVASWVQVDSLLGVLPGRVALSVWSLDDTDEHTRLHGLNASGQLAIGSTFKLYVLGALSEAVQRQRIQWSDSVRIRDEWKAIGSGKLRERPSGEYLSVLELAIEMMAISDNSATDHLIHILGRENVESWMRPRHSVPMRNIPFLTTREFFGLKFGADSSQLERYVAATVEARRDLLERAARNPPIRFPLDKPFAIDQVEWFASTDDLCQAMFALREYARQPELEPVLDAMSTRRRGLRLDADHWTHIAYKGGRESGVLNLTWLLQRADASWIALSVTFNDSDTDIDVAQASAAALAAVRVAARVEIGH
jgi:hypothetical protein